MTPEQIQIAVAESLGWKWNEIVGFWEKGTGWRLAFKYTESLDACREFEKDAPHQYWKILFELSAKVSRADDSMFMRTWANIQAFAKADALTRCEAWLRYKGLWKE